MKKLIDQKAGSKSFENQPTEICRISDFGLYCLCQECSRSTDTKTAFINFSLSFESWWGTAKSRKNTFFILVLHEVKNLRVHELIRLLRANVVNFLFNCFILKIFKTKVMTKNDLKIFGLMPLRASKIQSIFVGCFSKKLLWL